MKSLKAIAGEVGSAPEDSSQPADKPAAARGARRVWTGKALGCFMMGFRGVGVLNVKTEQFWFDGSLGSFGH